MIRTLVVDDDARVAEVHAAYVERVPGFGVVAVVHRGAEALEAVGRIEVELVPLDCYLPDISGLEVCRALRGRARGQPIDVMAITAARDVETVRGIVAQGVVHFLIKPFALATFREKLERYAAYRAQLEQRDETDQATVDYPLSALRGTPGPRLPKGLARPALDLVAGAAGRPGRSARRARWPTPPGSPG